MPKKPVIPFTRYSTPAILDVCLVEFMPSLPLLMILPEIPLAENLLYYVMVRVHRFGRRVELPDVVHEL